MTEWYVVIGGEAFGPLSEKIVKMKIDDGSILADTMVRKADSPTWEPACKYFPEAKLPPPKEALTNVTAPRPTEKRKLGAGLMIGIVFLPLIFSWFTLQKGHSVGNRVAAFVWLGLSLFFIVFRLGANSSDDQMALCRKLCEEKSMEMTFDTNDPNIETTRAIFVNACTMSCSGRHHN